MRRLLLLVWRISRADLRLMWFALRHPLRPRWLRPAALGLIVLAFMPINFAFPLIGVIDDMIVVPMLLHWLVSSLPSSVRQSFFYPSARSHQPTPPAASTGIHKSR